MAFLACFPGCAWAQVSGETCKAVAETVATGYTTKFTDDDFAAMRHYANCEARDHLQGGSLDLLYSAFSLGAKYNDQEKKSFCSSSYGQLGIKSASYTKVKAVFRDGFDVVSQCLQLAARNWDIKYKLYMDAVSLSIANLNPTGSTLRSIDVIPKNSLSCTGMPTSFPITVRSEGISLTCTRDAKTQVLGGAVTTTTSEAILNLQLADGPFAIKLPAYTNSGALEEINSRIEHVRKEFDKLRAELKTSASDPIVTVAGNSATCPDGYYAVGHAFGDQSGLAHGALWGPSLKCQKLNLGR